MPVYPGDPQPKFDPHATIKDNNANITRITVGSHTGTASTLNLLTSSLARPQSSMPQAKIV
jgi:arylformamidase